MSAPAAAPAKSQAQARPVMFAPAGGFDTMPHGQIVSNGGGYEVTDPVRWGVIGCADIAVKKVIPAMKGRS